MFNLENLMTAVSIAGTVGSATALLFEGVRGLVKSKAAEQLQQANFNRIANAVEVLQKTMTEHVEQSTIQHTDICQRVAKLEGLCIR